VTKETQIMRDIATATLTGNLTPDVELRPLPSGTDVARLRVASGTRRRAGEEWVERTNYFTVEVYGPQANLCAERHGKGARVVVDGELDWREWTDQEQNRRKAVRCPGRGGCPGGRGRRAVLTNHSSGSPAVRGRAGRKTP
jgi:single stranded DNA-binding protein